MYDDLDRMAENKGERTLTYKEKFLSREIGSHGYAEKALYFESICCFRESSLYWEYAYDLSKMEGRAKPKFKNRSEESLRVFQKLRDLLMKTVIEKRVGAIVMDLVFVHKDYEETLNGSEIQKIKSYLPEDFEYKIVAYHKASGEFAFFECLNFDTSIEPVSFGGIAVSKNGSIEKFRQKRAFKYKWMLVTPSYKGFPFYETVQKTLNYNSKTGRINVEKVDPKKKKTTYIYALYDPEREQEIKYVGKADDPIKRLDGHITETIKTPELSDKTLWIDSLLKQKKRPGVKIVEKVEYVYDLEWGDVEYRHIMDFRYKGHNLTNIESGGPRFGFRSDEMKMRRDIHKLTQTSDSKFKIELLKFRSNSRGGLKKMKRLWDQNNDPSLESRFMLRSIITLNLYHLVLGEGGSWCRECGVYVKKGWIEKNIKFLEFIFQELPTLIQSQTEECPASKDQFANFPCLSNSTDHMKLSLEKPLFVGLNAGVVF